MLGAIKRLNQLRADVSRRLDAISSALKLTGQTEGFYKKMNAIYEDCL